MKLRRGIGLGCALLALAGCATMPAKPTHVIGAWGGPHVALTTDGGISTLEFDCASGTIDSPIIPAPDGRFSVPGTYRPGQGGPVRVGQVFISQRATYSGTMIAEDMTLSAKLEDGTVLGPFTLRLGADPILTRCL